MKYAHAYDYDGEEYDEMLSKLAVGIFLILVIFVLFLSGFILIAWGLAGAIHGHPDWVGWVRAIPGVLVFFIGVVLLLEFFGTLPEKGR